MLRGSLFLGHTVVAAAERGFVGPVRTVEVAVTEPLVRDTAAARRTRLPV